MSCLSPSGRCLSGLVWRQLLAGLRRHVGSNPADGPTPRRVVRSPGWLLGKLQQNAVRAWSASCSPVAPSTSRRGAKKKSSPPSPSRVDVHATATGAATWSPPVHVVTPPAQGGHLDVLRLTPGKLGDPGGLAPAETHAVETFEEATCPPRGRRDGCGEPCIERRPPGAPRAAGVAGSTRRTPPRPRADRPPD